MNINGRALHYVFKIGNRAQNINFFKEILGMKILRHEEFTEGCDANCNGPYDNRWSKTMIGYGSEDTHFVMELTYNYNVNSYELGNDFVGICIHSNEAVANIRSHNWPMEPLNDCFVVKSPDGYPFFLYDKQSSAVSDPVKKVILSSSNLEASTNYWNKILGLKLLEKTESDAVFAFDEAQTKLALRDIGMKLSHKTSFGRIAFSVPGKELHEIDKKIKETNDKILTPLISLDTPGKATVTVIILADPDGHEICFVDDEGFRQLSVYDSNAESMLNKYIAKDETRKQ